MNKAEFIRKADTVCPPIENEEGLIAERTALLQKPALTEADKTRLEELFLVVGCSTWDDRARALIRDVANKFRKELGQPSHK